MPTVDARGLSCPEPVLRTRRAMDAGDSPISVLVDTVTQRENVRRAAEAAGCKVETAKTDDEFTLTLTR